MTQLEKLEALFTKNDEWNNDNPCEEGNKNPYPNRIQNTFIKWYAKNYTTEVSYETTEKGKISFNIDEDTIWDATTHAWFDCLDIDGCLDTVEYWIANLYEGYLYDDGLTLVGDISVKSVEKR